LTLVILFIKLNVPNISFNDVILYEQNEKAGSIRFLLFWFPFFRGYGYTYIINLGPKNCLKYAYSACKTAIFCIAFYCEDIDTGIMRGYGYTYLHGFIGLEVAECLVFSKMAYCEDIDTW